jgi:hypothetical protein
MKKTLLPTKQSNNTITKWKRISNMRLLRRASPQRLKLMHALYGLTEEEIKIVEGSKFSRYEKNNFLFAYYPRH